MSITAEGLAADLDRDALVRSLAELVRCESENPPGNEAQVAEIVAARCRSLGLNVSLHEGTPGRPSVVATWGSGVPKIGYCSHIDVVPAGDHAAWAAPPYDAVIRDGTMVGRGSSDAKGPIAAALAGIELLERSGFTPSGSLELALVADEEAGGFYGAAHLVESGVFRPDVAIIGEPTRLRVVRAQRGIAWSRVEVRGVAAHGSAPERGRNAIVGMAEVIRCLQETLPDITHPVVGGTTLNVGTIRGGDKVNMIPAYCAIEIDRRTIPGETREQVLGQFQAAIDRARSVHPDLEAVAEIVSWGSPFEVPESSSLVGTMAEAVGDVTGTPGELIGFRGTSDARFVAEAGADVIVFGPGDIAVAHTAREFVDLDQLADGAVIYALAFARLLGLT